MSDEPLYELAKDINMPGGYWRAGIKKTEQEWRVIFPIPNNQPFGWNSEWFINLSQKEEPRVDKIKEIIDAEFKARQLHSITYKEAAVAIAKKVLIEFYEKGS